MAMLVRHLDLVARRDFAALKKLCRVDDEDLAEMLRELRALDPKPGSAFGAAVLQPVVPDVVVRAAPAPLRYRACSATKFRSMRLGSDTGARRAEAIVTSSSPGP